MNESVLNENLKKSWTTHVRVFEKGNNYLVLKDTSQTITLFILSFLFGSFVSILLSSFSFSLSKGLFKIFFTTFGEEKKYFLHFMFSFSFLEIAIISCCIFLILKKFNFFFLELRFIDDRLKIINGNREQEILLSDDVIFSIDTFYSNGTIYRLNCSYFGVGNDSITKTIPLLCFGTSKDAKLVLERINKYLEQNVNYVKKND